MFTTKPGLFGLFDGWANPTGIALFCTLNTMVICSQPFIRRGGHFEVSNLITIVTRPFQLSTLGQLTGILLHTLAVCGLLCFTGTPCTTPLALDAYTSHCVQLRAGVQDLLLVY